MNVYMTEEEQLDLIKSWWNKYGNTVMSFIIVIMLSISIYHWWSSHQIKVKNQASNGYEKLMLSLANGDVSGVEANANNLIQNYSKSVYAQVASLIIAKQAVNTANYPLAIQHLNRVIAQHKYLNLQQIARIRAARIKASLKDYPAAIALLGKVVDQDYLSLVYEVRGDVYLAAGDKQLARQNYVLALKQLPATGLSSPILRMKLNELIDPAGNAADTTSQQEFEHRTI